LTKSGDDATTVFDQTPDAKMESKPADQRGNFFYIYNELLFDLGNKV